MRFTRLDGLLGNVLTLDAAEEDRHLYLGTGDPTVFNFTGLPVPKLGDLFISDGALYQHNGVDWNIFQASTPPPPNFSFRVIGAGSLLEIPDGQQMPIFGGCVEIEGELDVEGQLIMEQ